MLCELLQAFLQDTEVQYNTGYRFPTPKSIVVIRHDSDVKVKDKFFLPSLTDRIENN